MAPKVAFITDGNVIAGQGILEHLSKNTTEDEWSRIIVTSTSPLQATFEDPRVSFIALDFTQGPGELIELMQDSCADVTHAYFTSHVHNDDFAALNTANKDLFENFLLALTSVAPKLQNICLQTGANYYGSHLAPVPTPCREDDPRRGDPEDNFYFAQEDFLTEMQRNQAWSWNVIRPDMIVGPTIKLCGANTALYWAVYFMITKELGDEATMPTNQRFWNGTVTVSDVSLLAKFTIWASTNPGCANEAFNFVNGDHFTWRYMWPRLAEWFGAYSTPDQRFRLPEPDIGQVQQEVSLAEWAKDKQPAWDHICEKSGVPEAKFTFAACDFAAQDWVSIRSWTSSLSMNKARKFGWTESVDSFDSLIETFAKFKELKQIP